MDNQERKPKTSKDSTAYRVSSPGLATPKKPTGGPSEGTPEAPSKAGSGGQATPEDARTRRNRQTEEFITLLEMMPFEPCSASAETMALDMYGQTDNLHRGKVLMLLSQLAQSCGGTGAREHHGSIDGLFCKPGKISKDGHRHNYSYGLPVRTKQAVYAYWSMASTQSPRIRHEARRILRDLVSGKSKAAEQLAKAYCPYLEEQNAKLGFRATTLIINGEVIVK